MKPHVSEDALAAIATLGVVDAQAEVHLAACADCAARLDALARVLADVRAVAVEEADEVFDAERLNRQQDHVLRRLEHAGRPARVIEFPHRAGRAGRPVRPFAVRWVAAAAAAGLVIGVYAGSQINDARDRGASDRLARISAPASVPPASAPAVLDTITPAGGPGGGDDEILTEVEAALLTQGVRDLAALDALTPRFRDVNLRIR